MKIIDDWKAVHKFDKCITVIFAFVLIILGLSVGLFIALPAFIIFEGLRIKKPFLCMVQAVMLSLFGCLPPLIVGHLDDLIGDYGYVIILSLILFDAGIMGLLAFVTAKVAGSYEKRKKRKYEQKLTELKAKIEQWERKGYMVSEFRERWLK